MKIKIHEKERENRKRKLSAINVPEARRKYQMG